MKTFLIKTIQQALLKQGWNVRLPAKTFPYLIAYWPKHPGQPWHSGYPTVTFSVQRMRRVGPYVLRLRHELSTALSLTYHGQLRVVRDVGFLTRTVESLQALCEQPLPLADLFTRPPGRVIPTW